MAGEHFSVRAVPRGSMSFGELWQPRDLLRRSAGQTEALLQRRLIGERKPEVRRGGWMMLLRSRCCGAHEGGSREGKQHRKTNIAHRLPVDCHPRLLPHAGGSPAHLQA